MRSQSLSLQTPRSRVKAWERRQLLVKAEIRVLVQHPRRLIRQSQAGRFNSQEEGGGGGREEEELFSVVVSQNREVQRPEETEWPGLPRGPGPGVWLDGWHRESSKNSNNKTR